MTRDNAQPLRPLGNGAAAADARARPSLLQMIARMLPYARRRWRALAGVMTLMFLTIGVELLKPWPMKVIVDHVLYGKQLSPRAAEWLAILPGRPAGAALLGWALAATVVLFVVGWSLSVAKTFAHIAFAGRMVHDLARDLFAHAQRLSPRFHGRRPVGDMMRRITTDTSCVWTIVKDAVLPVAWAVASLVAMFGICWKLSPALTLMAFGALPIMFLAFKLYARPMMERGYRQQEAEGRVYSVVEQTLSAMPVVQAFSREDHAAARFHAGSAETLDAAMSVSTVQIKFKLLVGLATALGTAGILYIGGRHALAGELSVGTLIVFLSYLGSLYGPLNTLVYSTSTVEGVAGKVCRVFEVLDAQPELRDEPGASALAADGRGARGHVRLENVTFGYEPGRAVLKDVSLEARPGEVIAVVGPTGAGKSTLAGLVSRSFDPWAGRITLDGLDLRRIKLSHARAAVAVVPQESFLFPMTVAQNIAYGRPAADRAEVEAAARAANAHEFIERLPLGYDTVVGERGATLSGGQRQRLSIARALLTGAPVLILDEPTSALDLGSEAMLLQAIRRLASGRTTLIIAHRLSTIRNADRIIVMSEGRVVEQGNHERLLAAGGLYAKLYGVQFEPADLVGHNIGQGGPS